MFEKLDMNIIRNEQHGRFQKFASRVLHAGRVISVNSIDPTSNISKISKNQLSCVSK